MICNQCPRECSKDRKKEKGFCASGDEFVLARAALHFWEEPFISGKNGSGAIFFSGCPLKCVYCQNYEISTKNKGVEVGESKLIDIMKRLEDEGAENINLVNPTHYSLQLANLFEKYKPSVPIVYNCSGYEKVETLKELYGIVNIYLPDLKYIRPDKAKRYSFAEDYFEKANLALFEMRRQVSDVFYEDMMKSGMVIRHLILPSNTNSSIEILDYLKNNFNSTYISLMAQYVPVTNLEKYPEINRKITKREYNKVVDYAIQKDFEHLILQERSSSSDKFIPQFDFSGVL